ncbi:NACHT and WD domain-containing protein [Sclerotinia borealis F-4128]|uniref:NACHT and WD domain-containing protein n=1 Tax=Sclerotinia borealis (strain F-4128) TaxID=1432307 RepID=W9C929_SCLBF|nr:NACHT and WD domain-containing protein [Sclerotinia borealis F-4128]
MSAMRNALLLPTRTRHDTKEKSNIVSFLLSMASQMAYSDEGIMNNFLKTLGKDDHLKADYRTLWRKLFLDGIFKVQCEQIHYWVIDALDECQNEADMIALLIRTAEISSVHILITSRNRFESRQKLGKSKVRVLSEGILQEDSKSDITMYIEANMDDLPTLDEDGEQSILHEFLQLDLKTSTDGLEKSIRSYCGQLIDIDTNDQVQTTHLTARQFLLDVNTNSEFAVNEKEGHLRLLLAILRFFNDMVESPRRRRSSGNNTYKEGSALMGYASNYLSEHISHVPSMDRDVLLGLAKFFKSPNVLHWIEHITKHSNQQRLVETGKALGAFLQDSTDRTSIKSDDIELLTCWATDLFGSSIRNINDRGLRAETWDDCLATVLDAPEQYSSLACSNRICVWDLKTKVQLYVWQTPQQCMAISLDNEGRYLLAALKNHRLLIWDLESEDSPEAIDWTQGLEAMTIRLHRRPTTAAFGIGSNLLAVIYKGQDILLWSLTNDELVALYSREASISAASLGRPYGSSGVRCLVFGNAFNAHLLACAYTDGELVLFDTSKYHSLSIPTPSYCALSENVEVLIGTTCMGAESSERLVFLHGSQWVCATDTSSARTNRFARHFFFPADWLDTSKDSALSMKVTKKGDVLFVKDDEVAVVRRGLLTSELMLGGNDALAPAMK